jgi:hypothetical protein
VEAGATDGGRNGGGWSKKPAVLYPQWEPRNKILPKLRHLEPQHGTHRFGNYVKNASTDAPSTYQEYCSGRTSMRGKVGGTRTRVEGGAPERWSRVHGSTHSWHFLCLHPCLHAGAVPPCSCHGGAIGLLGWGWLVAAVRFCCTSACTGRAHARACTASREHALRQAPTAARPSYIPIIW